MEVEVEVEVEVEEEEQRRLSDDRQEKKKKLSPLYPIHPPSIKTLLKRAFPSNTATHELVVPRSIPKISFPAREDAEALEKEGEEGRKD